VHPTVPYTEVRKPQEGMTMTTATLTSKGQITIPADVRRALNVQTGDRVEFVQVQPGRFELVAATRSVRELKGMFGKPQRTVSIEEMNRTIAEQAAKAGLRQGRSK
jgi:antitoxin PrlF